MRKLKKIILTNFQKHSYLEINFNEDLNVITGLTDTGKSCIMRALQWIHGLSNLSEKDYRKEGTDETRVKNIYNDGYSVERIRSKSLNRYVLSKEGCEDQVFDAINRDVPEEIQKILEIKNINIDNQDLSLNFADQEDLNFIMDDSIKASYRAKLFNYFTGNELIDKLFKHLNKESLSLSKDVKSYTSEEEIKRNELVEIKSKRDELSQHLEIVKDLYNEINNDVSYYDEVINLAKKLSENNILITDAKNKLDDITVVSQSTVDELKLLNSKYLKLKELQFKFLDINNKNSESEKELSNLKITDINFSDLKKDAEKLDKLIKLSKKYKELDNEISYLQDQEIKNINIDFKELKELSQKHNKLCEIKNKISENKEKQEKIDKELSDIEKLIIDIQKEIEELEKQVPRCPTCGQIICGEK